MTTYVLVHGATAFGETWDPVRAHLEEANHEVHTPTAGGLTLEGPRDVGLEGAWRPILDYILSADLDDFVLLGHSWGGYLISAIAQQIPDRIRRLVYFNGFVPAHGRSLMDEIPPTLAEVFQRSADKRGDGTLVIPFDIFRDAFVGDAPIELVRGLYPFLRPQPIRTFTDKADMSNWAAVTAPRSYINALEDNDISQGEWGRHPRMSNRLGVFRLIQLPGSHCVNITEPELTAQKIILAGRD